MSTTEARAPRAYEAAEALGRIEALDRPADAIAKSVRELVPAGPVKDALSGTWLGHALHPLLTDIPIGSWTSALLLDWAGGRDGEAAAEKLLAIGLAATLPTVATGWTEWADTAPGNPTVKRMGLFHAAANASAAAVFAASLIARRRGSRTRGKLLALAGGALLGAGGHLGGHLTYAQAVGVDQTAFQQPDTDWTPVLDDTALPEGEPRCVEVDGVTVLVVRDAGRVHALSDRCSHRGGPLHEGVIQDGCVRCPLHGSTFRLSDGSVMRGPSPYPQPLWETRVRDGRIEVRPAGTS